MSIQDFLDWREQSTTFDLAASYGRDFNVSGRPIPQSRDRSSLFLFGVSQLDQVTFGGLSVALFVCGLGATYIPALRATKVDPLGALRYE